MHDFKFRRGELYCEDVRVADVAAGAGTPFYLYSAKSAEDHYKKIDSAFADVPHTICYSLKANSNRALCAMLAGLGAGADIVSGGELFIALSAGVPPGKIVYAGVGKTEQEIRRALGCGIFMFNVESVQELELINRVAGEAGTRARAALRLNPDVDASTHGYITTGTSANKFGLSEPDAEELFLKSSRFPNVEISGLHVHIGSQIVKLGPYIESVGKAADFIGRMKEKSVSLRYFNIGGGLGITYKDEEPSTADEFAAAVVPMLRKTGLHIMLEPGRFIMGNSGILVAKVLYVKKNRAKTFVIIDAGMNDLFRPALYGAYHDIKPLVLGNREMMTADIVGPICESGDFFARDREIPAVKQGDLLAIFAAGAYGYSMASNYNARPRAAELLTEGGRTRVIRERERLSDLVAAERFRFTKMCASGNDFIVVDNLYRGYRNRKRLAGELCSRKLSVGADGVIFIERARARRASGKDCDFRMRMFNPDGSEAEMCGNGAMCAAAYAFSRGISSGERMFMDTLAGRINAEVSAGGRVRLLMGEPAGARLGVRLKCSGEEFPVNAIDTGVPHAVILTGDIGRVDVDGIGRRIRNHRMFKPEGTNVDFVEVLDEHSIRVRTYERGVEAETLACGTGVVASALVCFLLGKAGPPVRVETRGGSVLEVCFSPGEGGPGDVYLEGEAGFVYDGVLDPGFGEREAG